MTYVKSFFIKPPIVKLIIALSLILIWWLIGQTKWADVAPNNMWFAKPFEVFSATGKILSNQAANIISTFSRVIISVLIVLFTGFIFGLFIGYHNSLFNNFKPSIDFWRSIPPIVVIPILLFWDTTTMKENWRIMLVLFGCFPLFSMLIAEAVVNASQKRLFIFQSLNCGLRFKMKNIILYEILPNFFTGTRTIISFAIIIIIVGEMVISPENGIGLKIIQYKSSYEIDFVYGYAIILGIIGYLLNLAIRNLERRIIKWN